MPETDDPGLDRDALSHWLATQGHRLDVDVPLRRFRGGLANLSYLISVDGVPAVLRRPPPGVRSEFSNDMNRTFRTLTALAGVFALAPAPIACCSDRAVMGSEFVILEYRTGLSIGATVPVEISGPEVGARLTESLIDTMAALHRLDPALIQVGPGPSIPFAIRQARTWSRRATTAFAAGPPRSLALILRTVADHVPADYRSTVVHGDLKFDNLLVDPDTLRPTALLDWDSAMLGDPQFDLAVLLSYWIEPGDPQPLHRLGQVPSLEPGFPTRREVAAGYAATSGHSIAELGFYLTLARLRLAVAWQQLDQLYAATDSRYRGFGALAATVLEWTAATLDDPVG